MAINPLPLSFPPITPSLIRLPLCTLKGNTYPSNAISRKETFLRKPIYLGVATGKRKTQKQENKIAPAQRNGFCISTASGLALAV